jgi:probable rRNA maturation factor
MLSKMSPKIHFFSDGVTLNIRNRKALKDFIEFIFRREKKRLQSINYIFCSDIKLRKINRQYLKHNYYTDIITFEISEQGTPIISEVYISIDRIKENAKTLGVTYKSELHRVIFHGALHLCGYSDKRPNDRKLMTQKEDWYLRKYSG